MKTIKKIAMAVVVIMITILLQTTKVQAGYQSIPTGSSPITISTTWIIGIRQMESAGQGLGLKETINTKTGLATSKSNNIDVHMQKNTEYGAILLLGASDYGKQGSSIEARRMDRGATSGRSTQASTTGNKYGVYEMGYYNMNSGSTGWEWTAGGGTEFLSNIAPRYRNIYSTATGKVGDATTETAKWHGSSTTILATGGNGFHRGNDGAFSSGSYVAGSHTYARAAVVVGAGL